MTTPSSPPRCQEPMSNRAHTARELCNREMVRASEGPCETCGCVEDGAVVHAQDKTGTWYCFRCAMTSGKPMREHAHPYLPPLVCPIHAAAPDRGEA